MASKTKNLCGKTRPVDQPYEVWQADGGTWTWRVLRKYQAPHMEIKNRHARWFCHVTSPMCPDGDLGDVYVAKIQRYAHRVA